MHSSFLNPDWFLGLLFEREANPENKAEQGKLSKNQQLVYEICNSASDTEKKVVKHLILRNLDSKCQPVGRQGIPEAYSGVYSMNP